MPLAAFRKQLRAGLSAHPARIVRLEHGPAMDFPVAAGNAPYLKVALIEVANRK